MADFTYQIPQQPEWVGTKMDESTEVDLHVGSPDLLSLDAARALRATRALEEVQKSYSDKTNERTVVALRQMGDNIVAFRREAQGMQEAA